MVHQPVEDGGGEDSAEDAAPLAKLLLPVMIMVPRLYLVETSWKTMETPLPTAQARRGVFDCCPRDLVRCRPSRWADSTVTTSRCWPSTLTSTTCIPRTSTSHPPGAPSRAGTTRKVIHQWAFSWKPGRLRY
ncbi:MAG: hypothetical protein JWN06_3415 [Propionibacteriaceae bacterium]|nr:hypothetical protein [Propionibacteriaceae bacterium]